MARVGAVELEPALRSIATGRPLPRLDAAHRRGRRRDAPAGGALNRLGPNHAPHHPAAPTTASSMAVALVMSETRVPTPLEQFPPARPPLGPAPQGSCAR